MVERWKVPLFALSILAVLATGCATYSKMYVNANGQIMQCSASGAGLIPMAMASHAVEDCGKNMRAAGYLEIDRAGVIGVMVVDGESGANLHILKVTPASPADSAGILAGDLLMKIDGQEVMHQNEAGPLLFGEAGTSVNVVTRRAERDMTFTIIRAPYSKVYGQKAAPAPNR